MTLHGNKASPYLAYFKVPNVFYLILKVTMEEIQIVRWKVLQTSLWISDPENFSS